MLMGSGYGKFLYKHPVGGRNERDPDMFSYFPIFFRTQKLFIRILIMLKLSIPKPKQQNI